LGKRAARAFLRKTPFNWGTTPTPTTQEKGPKRKLLEGRTCEPYRRENHLGGEEKGYLKAKMVSGERRTGRSLTREKKGKKREIKKV